MKLHLPVALLAKLMLVLAAVVSFGVYENEHPDESLLDGSFFSGRFLTEYTFTRPQVPPVSSTFATGNSYAERPVGSGFRAVAGDPGDKLVYTTMPSESGNTALFATGSNLRGLEASSRYSDTGKGCYFSQSYSYYQPYKGAEELHAQSGNWGFMGPNLTPSINHGSGSVSGALGGLTHDVSMCWANATANVLQYWQSYYGVFYDGKHGELPYGWNYDPSLAPTLGGSQSLAIYNEFYKHWYDEGGTFKWASDWYCRGVDPSRTYIKDEGLGGWWEMDFGENKAYVITYFNGSSKLESLTRVFAASLGYTQQADKTWAQTTAGQIGYLGISSYLGGHALTCWGMDFDEAGMVHSIYIANSDDLQYGTVQLFLKSVDGQYYLFSDADCTEYWNWNAANWYLDEVSYLNTPQRLKDLYRAYSTSDLTWTGKADEWSVRLSADQQIGYALPDANAGWTADVNGTSYHSYYDAGRNLVFGDTDGATTIATAGTLSAGRVELANTTKDYLFTASEAQTSLTAESLHAATARSASFRGMELSFSQEMLLDGYGLKVTDGSLTVGTGILQGGASLTLENAVASFTELLLGNGTTLTLDLSRAGDEQALLSVSGTLTIAGALTLNVGGLPTDLTELYVVMSAGEFDTASWGDNITLNGTTTDKLFWRDNVLYYGSYVDKQYQYFTEHTEAPDKWRKFEGLSFTGISYAQDGAALTNLGTLSFEKNGPVEFSGNSTRGSGGAVANAGTLDMAGNKSVLFRSNSAAETGGALSQVGGQLSISGSQSVAFERNTAMVGGALHQSGGSASLSGNAQVSFAQNRATDAGGAVFLSGGSLQLSDNTSLSFTGNSTNGNGGALYNEGGQMVIRGNGDTAFTGNHAGGSGGALYNSYGGRVTLFADAGDITFRGNTQGSGANTILRAIHSQGDIHTEDSKTYHISAAAGHTIAFYDSVQVENSSYFGQTNFNTQGSGTILFSGKYAEQDLREATGSVPSQTAVSASLASSFSGFVYLAGGTLRIEDGATLSMRSLYFADGAASATISLSNGALYTPEWQLDFNLNKTLELSGVNTISTSYFVVEDGGTLTFNLGDVNRSSAALTAITSDIVDLQGSLTLNLNGTDSLAGGMYKLIETTNGYRNNATLTVNGAAAEALLWKDGTLWFDADYRPPVEPSTDLVFTETQRGDLTLRGNDSLTFTPASGRAIDETGAEPAFVRLAENGDVYFHDISITGDGGTIGNVSHGAAAPSVIVLEDNTMLEITRSKTTGDGGAISNIALSGGEASLLIRSNNTDPNMGAANLTANSAGGRGGMLFNSGTARFTENGEISFVDNYAADDGGALYNARGGELELTENNGVNLGRNRSDGRGGAIANYGATQLSDNNYVTAAGNSSLFGAAVYNEGSLEMARNGYIQFAGNDCTRHEDGTSLFGIGGNLCNTATGEVTIRDNGNVSLSSAYALYGGSIYNEGRVSITNNRDINIDSASVEGNGGGVMNHGSFILSGNRNVTFNEDWAWSGFGGAICNMQGYVEINDNESLSVFSSYTAFSNGTTGGEGKAVMSIGGNGDILFYDNIAYRDKGRFDGKAGAILNLADGTLNICGNGNVEFRNNTILTFAESSPTGKDFSYLHALHNEGTLNLSAAEGKRIIFYDAISSAQGSTVNLNAAYTDSRGETHRATGDIVFSGLKAESMLRSNMLAEYVTAETIRLSKTSDVKTDVILYDGRLRVEDEAVLNTRSLTAEADATIRVSNGTLTAAENVTIRGGATLELLYGAALAAEQVDMQAGSTLSLDAKSFNATLDAKLLTEGVTLALSNADVAADGTILLRLGKDGVYDTRTWNSANISVIGADFNTLVWENGELRYQENKDALILTHDDTHSGSYTGNAYVRGADADVIISGSIAAGTDGRANGNLTIEGGTTTLTAGASVENGIIITGESTLRLTQETTALSGLSVQAEATLLTQGNRTETAQLTITKDGVLSTDNGMMTLRSADGTNSAHGSRLTLSENGIAGQGTRLVNTLIDLKKGAVIELSDVVLAAGTRVTDDPARVLLRNVTAQAEMGVNAERVSDSVLPAADFVQSGNTTLTATEDGPVTVTNIVLTTFDTVTLSGETLAVSLSGLGYTEVKGYDYIALAFTSGSGLATFERNLAVTLTLTETGTTMRGWYRGDEFAPTAVYFDTLQAPEPASSALSLLALTALTARRKR